MAQPTQTQQILGNLAVWPDVSGWRHLLEQLGPSIGMILVGLGTHNWTLVGSEALKDVPTILATLGLTGAGIGGLVTGWLSKILNGKSIAAAQTLYDSVAEQYGLYLDPTTKPAGPQPVAPMPVLPQPAPAPVDPNETSFSYNSGGVRVELHFKPDADGQVALDMLSAAVGKRTQKVIEATATPHV